MSEKLTEKTNQPVYRAASETAHAELRQIADRLNQLRIRQEQISTAVQALKLLASAQESVPVANKPIHAMNGRVA